MGVLSLDYLCLGKTAQLSIPVTRKGVSHIFSFSFKPEDSIEGGGSWEMGDVTCSLAALSRCLGLLTISSSGPHFPFWKF